MHIYIYIYIYKMDGDTHIFLRYADAYLESRSQSFSHKSSTTVADAQLRRACEKALRKALRKPLRQALRKALQIRIRPSFV